jgi:RNA polymerase sigma-70 factor (ECF subfamily)
VPSLSEAFLAALPEQARSAWSALGGLEEELEAMWEAARAAWPEIALSGEQFAGYLAERVPAEDPPDQVIAALLPGDLLLACGCVQGDPRALEAFESVVFPSVEAALRRTGLGSGVAADVSSAIREQILVGGPGSRPKLADYQGRGPLHGWLRVTAVRMAIRIGRQHGREIADDRALASATAKDVDPELAYMKTVYRAEFKAAFAEAMQALSPRERNLLRQRFADGLRIEQLAKLYDVHVATIGRWLAQARESVFTETRAVLVKRLRIERAEFESILRVVRSQLDLTLSRWSAGTAE